MAFEHKRKWMQQKKIAAFRNEKCCEQIIQEADILDV